MGSYREASLGIETGQGLSFGRKRRCAANVLEVWLRVQRVGGPSLSGIAGPSPVEDPETVSSSPSTSFLAPGFGRTSSDHPAVGAGSVDAGGEKAASNTRDIARDSEAGSSSVETPAEH